MSGPKVVSYSLDEGAAWQVAAQLRSDAARFRRDRLRARLEDLKMACLAWQAEGLSVGPDAELGRSVENMGVEEIEFSNELAARMLEKAEKALAEAARRERQESLRRAMAAVGVAGRTREAGVRQHCDSLDRGAKIDTVIALIPEGMSDEEEEAINVRVSALAETDDAQFESYLIGVKAEIQSVKREVARRARMRRRAEDLLMTLDGLEGREVEGSRSLLKRAIAGATPLLDSDVAAVGRVREAAVRVGEDRFVAEAIEEAFGSCGFDIGPDFSVDLATGDESYVASRSSRDHAVAVRMGNGRLDLRVVRTCGPTDAGSDTVAEIEFCKDLGVVSSEMHGLGIDLDLVRHQPAGVAPVEVINELEGLAARRRRGRRTRGRMRER